MKTNLVDMSVTVQQKPPITRQERTDKLSDEDRRFSQEKGLIGYRAGVSKANSIVGYSEDGTPLTFADVKPGMTVYADAVGREKISKKTIEEQQWELLSPEEKKMSARGLINKGANQGGKTSRST